MSDVTGRPAGEAAAGEAPSTWGRRLRLVGPGIVIAVTGVGAGDMISSLVAGTDFGTVLIWAILIGAFLKFVLTEGIGRWYMASGETILRGWHMLGRGATWYFHLYLFIVTFVFGAAVTSTAALGVDAMFPNLLRVWAWAALPGILGFVIVGIGRYDLFERIMKAIAAVKFGAIILLAILLTPSLTDLALGLVPRIPEGGFINVHQRDGDHRRGRRDVHARLLYLLGARARLAAGVLDPDYAHRSGRGLRPDGSVHDLDARHRG
jgi:Mn2+/Fe2+ NRAMP family transporter